MHLVEKLCSFFLLDIQNHSWRASGQEGPRGIGSGCEAHSARTRHNTTCIKQGYKTSARPNSPWSPSQEGARGQGSSACRGTPSRGEARALHHQPVPAIRKRCCVSTCMLQMPTWHVPAPSMHVTEIAHVNMMAILACMFKTPTWHYDVGKTPTWHFKTPTWHFKTPTWRFKTPNMGFQNSNMVFQNSNMHVKDVNMHVTDVNIYVTDETCMLQMSTCMLQM